MTWRAEQRVRKGVLRKLGRLTSVFLKLFYRYSVREGENSKNPDDMYRATGEDIL